VTIDDVYALTIYPANSPLMTSEACIYSEIQC